MSNIPSKIQSKTLTVLQKDPEFLEKLLHVLQKMPGDNFIPPFRYRDLEEQLIKEYDDYKTITYNNATLLDAYDMVRREVENLHIPASLTNIRTLLVQMIIGTIEITE